MFSISAKVLLPMAALLIFVFSCSREKEEPPFEPKSLYGSDYKGGIFPVWITLKEPVKDASSIRWRTGNSLIAYRKQAIDEAKNLITADTAFLYWDRAPQPFIKLDSTEIGRDSTKTWKIDTTYYYRDTIFAIVDGFLESQPIVIEVKNILPRVTNLSIDGLSQPGDSLLTVAAHPGDKLEIRLSLEKPFKNAFNQTFQTLVALPISGLKSKGLQSDSLYVWEWTVPNEEIADSSLYLRITDTGGHGERLYKIHLVVYTESGSVWVASQNELVKYSPSGAEVARINDNFKLISDIAVHSKDKRLFVADQEGNSLSIYDTYGRRLYKTDSLKSPTSIAIGVEISDSKYVWIADAEDIIASTFKARLRRYVFNGDSLRLTNARYDMSGPIKGLSVDQYNRDFLWFAIPESDTIGFVRNPDIDTVPQFIAKDWRRPSMISHDPVNGTTWVADSTRIVAIDSAGTILANIDGFKFVSSVSAGNGSVWAADILNKKVYRFKGPFRGLALKATDGMLVDGFISPVSVSAFTTDGGAWVIDEGAGTAVRLDSIGNKIAFGTGLTLLKLGKTLQTAE